MKFQIGDYVQFKPPGDQHKVWIWRINDDGTYYVKTVPIPKVPCPPFSLICSECGQLDPKKQKAWREYFDPFGSYGWDNESGDRFILLEAANDQKEGS